MPPHGRVSYTLPMVEARATAPFKVQAAGATDIGRVRLHNEDSVLVRADLHLYVVADGAGGENAGNVASALATTRIAHFFEATHAESKEAPIFDEIGLYVAAKRLSRAIQAANREIVGIAKTNNNYHGMGTTVVAGSAQPDLGLFHVGHVGDSRCYRLRDARLERLSDDHSLAQDVLELRPDVPAEALKALPSNVITRALGMSETLRVSIRSHVVVPGDRFLLCSDGLTDALNESDVGDVLRVAKAPEEASRILVDMANQAGAEDNLAAVVVMFDLAPGVSSFPRTPPSAPARTKRVKTAPQVTEVSAPEIVILGVETLDEESPQIHVVPAESSSPNLLGAIGNFVGPLRPKSSPPTSAAKSKDAPTCAKCGKPIANRGLVCPFCGTPRDVKR